MTTLVPGGNAPVATGQLRVDISYTPAPGADIDISAFALTTSREFAAMATCASTVKPVFWVELFS